MHYFQSMVQVIPYLRYVCPAPDLWCPTSHECLAPPQGVQPSELISSTCLYCHSVACGLHGILSPVDMMWFHHVFSTQSSCYFLHLDLLQCLKQVFLLNRCQITISWWLITISPRSLHILMIFSTFQFFQHLSSHF